jgi:protein-tyrosine-phosphatase
MAADRPAYCGTERWRSLIAEASTRFEMPQVWLHGVMRAESAGCEAVDGYPITSTVGEIRAALNREVNQERWTSLDRDIQGMARDTVVDLGLDATDV